MNKASLVVAIGCLAAALGVIGVAAAQQETSSAPDLAAASFTAAQVDNGHAEYVTSCIDCHGPNLNDGEFGGPPLNGPAFQAKWFARPVGALIQYTHAAMPPDSPGRLPLGTYVEIIAYLLNANGVPAGQSELPADMSALNKLRIVGQK
jgi:mono/diheme cytochrome c family protein